MLVEIRYIFPQVENFSRKKSSYSQPLGSMGLEYYSQSLDSVLVGHFLSAHSIYLQTLHLQGSSPTLWHNVQLVTLSLLRDACSGELLRSV